jgi:F0F1-type ATP synthase membrane subunit b/b'
MATANTQGSPSSTIDAYDEKIKAQMQDAKAKLEQLEAKARDKTSQADTAAINNLKTAKANIDRKLQDLKKTHDANVTRAKADIDADVATFENSIDEVSAKVKASSPKK